MSIIIRPSTAADLCYLFGQPNPFRSRALSGFDETGRLLGAGGVHFLPDGTVVAWLVLDDEAEPQRFAKTLHKVARTFLDHMRAMGFRRIVAFPEDGVVAAERWLRRLGFRQVESDAMRIFVRD